MTTKRDFLNSQFLAMTLAATTQRSNLYGRNVGDDARVRLRSTLFAALEEESKRYTRQQTDEQHIASILRVADRVTNACASDLDDKHMKIGHAQKALNLYLKYLWCAGEIPTPPHCPIDSIILQKIPGCTEVRWTRLDDHRDYERIIKAAREVARKQGKSLAEWELEEYRPPTHLSRYVRISCTAVPTAPSWRCAMAPADS